MTKTTEQLAQAIEDLLVGGLPETLGDFNTGASAARLKVGQMANGIANHIAGCGTCVPTVPGDWIARQKARCETYEYLHDLRSRYMTKINEAGVL